MAINGKTPEQQAKERRNAEIANIRSMMQQALQTLESGVECGVVLIYDAGGRFGVACAGQIASNTDGIQMMEHGAFATRLNRMGYPPK